MDGSTRLIRRVAALELSLLLRVLDILRTLKRRMLKQRLPSSGIVLYYHAVTVSQRARFAWQMDELLKRTSPVRADLPEDQCNHRRYAAITFDDGYRSVVDNAVPELEKRNIPFTVFVPSGCLGRRPSWVHNPKLPFWAEQVISADQLRKLASAPLATLGSHSVTHANLRTLGSEHAARELADSRKDLRDASGAEVDLFSFPHGAWNQELLELAHGAGYRKVFTIEPVNVESEAAAFAVGRVAADPDDWPIEFRLKVEGAYRWRAYLHRLTNRDDF